MSCLDKLFAFFPNYCLFGLGGGGLFVFFGVGFFLCVRGFCCWLVGLLGFFAGGERGVLVCWVVLFWGFFVCVFGFVLL